MSRNALVSLALLASCVQEPAAIPVDRVFDGPSFAFAAPVLPAGQAKVNRSCYGATAVEKPTASRTASGSSGAGVVGANAPSAPPTTSTAPRPAAPAMADSAAPIVAREEAKSAVAEIATSEAEAPRDRAALDDAPAASGLDWGGTTWLSNDDSMSLASAQRTIWALQHGKSPAISEVRPHELLNYFSFDTVAPSAQQAFGITAVAEKIDADSMSLAFAVKGATPERRPLDLTLVVDRSGSMSSEGRMSYVKQGLGILTEQLHSGDRVDVVLFDNVVCTPLEDYVVGRDDPALLKEAIDAMQPRNGTNIGVGLKEAYRIAAARPSTIQRNQRVMLLTDALVNQGIVGADTLSEIGRGFDEHDIRLTGVGVGAEFDDRVLDKLTEKGKGAYVYLGSEAVTKRVFGVGFDSLVETIAHDVKFELDLPPSMAMERFYGEESSTNPEEVQAINYYAGTTQLFLQDLTIDPAKLSPQDKVVLTVHYRDAKTDEPVTQVFESTVGAMMKGDRHNVDKARALMAFADVVAAGAMGGNSCSAVPTWTERGSRVSDDAEIAFVQTLVKGTCATTPDLAAPPPPTVAASVAYKVKVDSDTPIAEVVLWCSGAEQRTDLSPGTTVARFTAAPGECTLTLNGAMPMTVAVNVPEVGGETRCMVRGGRVSCS